MLVVLTPAVSQDLSTLDTVKSHLGITGSAQDAAVLLLLRQASGVIRRWCGQPFGRERVQQTERDCHSSGVVILERSLAVSIESFAVGDTVLTADDWTLEGAVLRPWPYGWNARQFWGLGVISIVYASGYDLLGDLPYEVERAALVTCAGMWSTRGRDPTLRSETAEGVGTLSYATTAAAGIGPLPAEAIGLLEPFRRFWP